MKLPAQIKSLNGVNKMQRDSIGESNCAEYEGRMGLMQVTPNFYEFPATNAKNPDGLSTIAL